MNKMIPFKKQAINLAAPIIWLAASLIWVFNIIAFGFDSLKFTNVIVTLLCAVIWYYRYLWQIKNNYLIITDGFILMNLSMIINNKTFHWKDIVTIQIEEKKIRLFTKDFKQQVIYLKIINEDDKKYLLENIKTIWEKHK